MQNLIISLQINRPNKVKHKKNHPPVISLHTLISSHSPTSSSSSLSNRRSSMSLPAKLPSVRIGLLGYISLVARMATRSAFCLFDSYEPGCRFSKDYATAYAPLHHIRAVYDYTKSMTARVRIAVSRYHRRQCYGSLVTPPSL